MILSALLAGSLVRSLPGGSLGELFAILVVTAVVVLVGRIALRIAWRLVTIAALVVGVLLLVMMFVPGSL